MSNHDIELLALGDAEYCDSRLHSGRDTREALSVGRELGDAGAIGSRRQDAPRGIGITAVDCHRSSIPTSDSQVGG